MSFWRANRWDQTVKIVRRRTVTDKYGNPRVTESVVGDARGRFAPGGQDISVGVPGKLTVAVTDSAAWYFPPGTVVDADDAVVDSADREWRVTEVADWPMGTVAKVVSWGQV